MPIFLKFADNKYRQHEAAILAEYQQIQGGRREKKLSDIAIERCGFYLRDHARYDPLLQLSPSTGVEYSLALRSELARRLSAARQRSASSFLSWSLFMGLNHASSGLHISPSTAVLAIDAFATHSGMKKPRSPYRNCATSYQINSISVDIQASHFRAGGTSVQLPCAISAAMPMDSPSVGCG